MASSHSPPVDQRQRQQHSEQQQQQQQQQHLSGSIIVFTAPLAKQLNESRIRLPPNFVGSRRIRPSSRLVRNAMMRVGGKEISSLDSISDPLSKTTSRPVIFKVVGENGEERRMTNQEKKTLKFELAMAKKESKKKRKLEETVCDQHLPLSSSTGEKEDMDSSTSYHQLQVNNATLEQEIAELRGQRNVPPVVLSPPMALQAITRCDGLLTLLSSHDKIIAQSNALVHYDDDLSQKWAQTLKQSMFAAEKVREKEDMRPMAYQLLPEPWSRLRPASLCQTKLTTAIRPTSSSSSSSVPDAHVNLSDPVAASLSTIAPKARQWVEVSIRPAHSSNFDSDASIVFELLHRQTSYYVSCGAKFGCDFLLYDGPREERHAFAGLRILPSPCPSKQEDSKNENSDRTDQFDLPLPTAYSLAGYVRGLNTAGKLALIATVIRDHDSDSSQPLYRVGFVDVALEKILTAPTHQRRSRTKVRRDVTQNLAKN
jgi:hypothetical protein